MHKSREKEKRKEHFIISDELRARFLVCGSHIAVKQSKYGFYPFPRRLNVVLLSITFTDDRNIGRRSTSAALAKENERCAGCAALFGSCARLLKKLHIHDDDRRWDKAGTGESCGTTPRTRRHARPSDTFTSYNFYVPLPIGQSLASLSPFPRCDSLNNSIKRPSKQSLLAATGIAARYPQRLTIRIRSMNC